MCTAIVWWWKVCLAVCVWKLAFLKSGHIYSLSVSILSDVRPMFFSQLACLATGQSPAHTHVISTPGHQWNQSCHDWMLKWCSTHHIINRWKQLTAPNHLFIDEPARKSDCHFYFNNSNQWFPIHSKCIPILYGGWVSMCNCVLWKLHKFNIFLLLNRKLLVCNMAL